MMEAKGLAFVCLLVVWAFTGAHAIDCPVTTAYNGCLRSSCISIKTSGNRSPTTVCNRCGPGYVLVAAGTKDARCDCAPGYAGKGNSNHCRRCPEGTHIAPGGAKPLSECINCLGTAIISQEAKDCLCPTGQMRVLSTQPTGYRQVTCQQSGIPMPTDFQSMIGKLLGNTGRGQTTPPSKDIAGELDYSVWIQPHLQQKLHKLQE